MPRRISKKFLRKVEVLETEIEELINEARTIEQAGHLQEMLANAAVDADEKVCRLDS